MLHHELNMQVASERRRDQLAAAEHYRLIAACRPQPTLSRWMAGLLGHALVRIGARLVRYGRVGAPAATRPYRATARSIKLN